jgi:hypothetical protein
MPNWLGQTVQTELFELKKSYSRRQSLTTTNIFSWKTCVSFTIWKFLEGMLRLPLFKEWVTLTNEWPRGGKRNKLTLLLLLPERSAHSCRRTFCNWRFRQYPSKDVFERCWNF